MPFDGQETEYRISRWTRTDWLATGLACLIFFWTVWEGMNAIGDMP